MRVVVVDVQLKKLQVGEAVANRLAGPHASGATTLTLTQRSGLGLKLSKKLGTFYTRNPAKE